MIQKILILLNLIVALGASGVVFYSHNIIKPPPTDQVAEAEAIKTDAITSTQLQPVLIKKFAVNLHSRSTRLRYLDIEMNVLTFEEAQKPIIKASEHLFKDMAIEVASHLDPEELDSITGKILFENKVKKRVNALISEKPTIKQIYFSVFVVQ
jgi:flagellar FliL protein